MAKKKAAKAASRKGVGKVITNAVAEKWLKDSESVDLSTFQQLDDDAARVLAKHKNSLNLNGLTQLSDTAAKALGAFKGYWLELNGLSDVTESCARNLAKSKAHLQLNGLKDLSDSVAQALASHPGSLVLGGLEKCSDKGVKYLASLQDDLEIGLPTLTDVAVKALSSFSKKLTLSGIRVLSDCASKSLQTLDRDGRLEVSDQLCKTMKRLKDHGYSWHGLLKYRGWKLDEKKVKWQDVPDKACKVLRNAFEYGVDLDKVKITRLTLTAPKGGQKHEYFVGDFDSSDMGIGWTYVVNDKAVVSEDERD